MERDICTSREIGKPLKYTAECGDFEEGNSLRHQFAREYSGEFCRMGSRENTLKQQGSYLRSRGPSHPSNRNTSAYWDPGFDWRSVTLLHRASLRMTLHK